MKYYSLLSKKAMEILEYGKNNKSYWNRIKLVKQVKEKVLLIVKVVYLII